MSTRGSKSRKATPAQIRQSQRLIDAAEAILQAVLETQKLSPRQQLAVARAASELTKARLGD